MKLVSNKVNAKVASLRRVRNFIPTEVMVTIYKAFILPHLEYCSSVLIGLTPGLSKKLELTNQYRKSSIKRPGRLLNFGGLRGGAY